MLKKLIFLGPPGAGKGTMAEKLVSDYPLDHIATGDILRAEMRSGSQLGKEAKGYVDEGSLVPDEVVTRIVAENLESPQSGSEGFVLDGFPRTVQQAQLLDDTLEKKNIALDAVIFFEADQDLLIRRLSGRRICQDCGAVYNLVTSPPKKDGVCDSCSGQVYQRSDDTEETVKDRLRVYEEQTAPLVDFYEQRGLLKRIPADREIEENYRILYETLGA